MEFTEEELDELWNAVAAYVENHEDEGVPPGATTALEKLDRRKAALADGLVVTGSFCADCNEPTDTPGHHECKGVRETTAWWRQGLYLLPKHMHRAVTTWIEEGQPNPNLMGAFLRAVFQNRLVEAFKSADPENMAAMPRWAHFLDDYAPPSSWGSPEQMSWWFQTKGRLEVDVDRVLERAGEKG